MEFLSSEHSKQRRSGWGFGAAKEQCRRARLAFSAKPSTRGTRILGFVSVGKTAKKAVDVNLRISQERMVNLC